MPSSEPLRLRRVRSVPKACRRPSAAVAKRRRRSGSMRTAPHSRASAPRQPARRLAVHRPPVRRPAAHRSALPARLRWRQRPAKQRPARRRSRALAQGACGPSLRSCARGCASHRRSGGRCAWLTAGRGRRGARGSYRSPCSSAARRAFAVNLACGSAAREPAARVQRGIATNSRGGVWRGRRRRRPRRGAWPIGRDQRRRWLEWGNGPLPNCRRPAQSSDQPMPRDRRRPP